MEFVIGFLGAFVALILCFGCVAFGWFLRDLMLKKETRVTAEELSDRERQELKEAIEAQHILHNYNADMAYGLHLDKRSDSI